MTCYASDLEGRKDESVPPDLWFVMQLSHSALEAATTAPTGLASSTNETRCEETRKGKARHVGTKRAFQATTELGLHLHRTRRRSETSLVVEQRVPRRWNRFQDAIWRQNSERNFTEHISINWSIQKKFPFLMAWKATHFISEHSIFPGK